MPPTCEFFTNVRDEDCDKCEKVKETKGSKRLFLKSVSVWINKPHVINRRLCGSKIVHVVRVDSEQDAFIVVNQYTWSSGKTNESEEKCLHFSDLVDESAGFTVVFRELIPKSEFFPKLLEAVVYGKISCDYSASLYTCYYLFLNKCRTMQTLRLRYFKLGETESKL